MNLLSFTFFKLRLNNRSSLLIIFFLFLMVVLALLSDSYQTPIINVSTVELYKNPFPEKFLPQIQKISFRNRLGSFQIEKSGNAWWLTGAERRPVNPLNIENILTALKEIKVRKIFNLDPVNLANFSLKNPLLSMILYDQNNRAIQFNIGIVNPIDSSTYVTLSDHQSAYQVDAFKFPIENLDYRDLLDSRIFSLTMEELTNINIFLNQKNGRQQLLSLYKKNSYWFNSKNQQLSSTKVKEFITQLSTINSGVILDKKTRITTSIVEKYLSSPRYVVELTTKNLSRNYRISDLILESIPELKINKAENILISASDKENPFIIGKEYLRVLELSEDNLL